MKIKFVLFLLLISVNNYAQKKITDSIKIHTPIKQYLEINYSNLIFTNSYKPWQSAFIQYLYKKNNSTFIPRLNFSNRYKINGVQFEIDEYQKFKNKYYAYFNYAFSNSILFPKHRYGIELYKGFNKINEISLGVKQLFFNGNKTATFFTSSYSRYIKNNLLSYRVFLVPKTHSISSSHNFSLRHYLKKDDEFISVLLGIGFAQPETTNTSLTAYSADPAFFLRNQRVAFSFQKFINKTIQIKPSIEINRQELSVFPNHFQLLYLFNLGIAKKIS